MNGCCRKLQLFIPLHSSQRSSSLRICALPDDGNSARVDTEWTCSRRATLAFSLMSTTPLLETKSAWSRESSIYDFQADIYEKQRSLAEYRNQNLNYPGLRTLVEKYSSQGFNLIAFPCNQFGKQAPGTSQEEREYAIRKFGFEFDVFDKIDVNGLMAHPLYKYLRQEQSVSSPKGAYSRPGVEAGAIEWNYTKFLINRQGKPVRRYTPSFDPLAFEGDVVNLLNGKDPLPEECLVNPNQMKCTY